MLHPTSAHGLARIVGTWGRGPEAPNNGQVRAGDDSSQRTAEHEASRSAASAPTYAGDRAGAAIGGRDHSALAVGRMGTPPSSLASQLKRSRARGKSSLRS